MNRPVIIMNFTQVYQYESFAHKKQFYWLDCTHVRGTGCYCDKEASQALKQLIADYPAEGIHFIDSGNYHYLTKFWTDKIDYPFSLIVFDHHPDMQPPLFEDLISCGSWVKDVIDTNPYLRKVLIVGASERLIQAVPETYGSKVCFYGERALQHETTWRKFAAEHIGEPVYISIDKDVLNPQFAVTNWDQGSLSLNELENLLTLILRGERIIGVDICGECPVSLNMFEERRESAINSRANEALLDFFRNIGTNRWQVQIKID